MKTTIQFLMGIGACILLGTNSWAGNLTIPNTFTADTPAVAAEVNNNFSAVETAVDDNDSRVATLEATVAALQATINTLQSQMNTITSSNVMALDPYVTMVNDSRGPIATFSGLNMQLVNGTETTEGAPNGLGNFIIGYDEMRTDSTYFCSIGFYTDQLACENDSYSWAVSHKTGSHNLVIGDENNYSQIGGLVVGRRNTSNNYSASAIGGFNNVSSGHGATVSGGWNNTASGDLASSISGGANNIASGSNASVSGGALNIASGGGSSISGGAHNIASSGGSSISGGSYNTASGFNSSVSGGGNGTLTGGNTASHDYSVILGGSNQASTANFEVNSADPRIDVVQATIANQASQISAINNSEIMALDSYVTVANDSRGPIATFSGLNLQLVNGTGSTDGTPNALGNLIIGYDAARSDNTYFCSTGALTDQTSCETNGYYIWAVSHKTGSHNLVIGDQNNYSQYAGLVAGIRNTSNYGYASVSGGNNNTASGSASSISGGAFNTASGGSSSVSGGSHNTASGTRTSVSGGTNNTASGSDTNISGGGNNNTSGWAASVSGGFGNSASGTQASVSGGAFGNASGDNSNISGGYYNTANGPGTSVSGGGNGIQAGGNTASHNYSSILGGVGNTTTSASQTIPALP